jgi:NADPH:quinone reductase-like Zn-dependent oxidoreductase
VIGAASEGTFEFLRQLGAEPVGYASGLVERIWNLALDGVTAAADLLGTRRWRLRSSSKYRLTGSPRLPPGPTPPGGMRATGGSETQPDALERVTDAILAGKIIVPIAATFPIEQIRDAVKLQAGRHVDGKVVITL